MYDIKAMPCFGERATIILISNQTMNTALAQTTNPHHFHHQSPKH